MNCHGCKWLDETRPAGNGYCCMVERSKTQTEKVRRSVMFACELYEPGDFHRRYDGSEISVKMSRSKSATAQETEIRPREREISFEEMQALEVGCRVNIYGKDEGGQEKCIKCTIARRGDLKFLTYRDHGALRRAKLKDYPGKRFAKVV